MTQTINGKDERMFTIELESKSAVKNVSLDRDEKIVIEGSLGSFKRARFLEDLILEIVGGNGELRIDLAMRDLERRIKSEGSSTEVGM